MPICRTIIAIGCLGSVCLLAGCGTASFTSDGSLGSEDFFSAGVDDFGGNRPLVVEADKTTSQATTVSLPADLLEDAADHAVIVLSAADITATVNGELSGRKNPTAKAAEHHARVTFHFAAPGKDACDSDDEVGSFELTIEDGVVTLAEESLPLDIGARSTVRNGKFEACSEIWADFDGSVFIENITFEFGRQPHNENQVIICHIPPGNPDNTHTITVGAPAVDAHLAHGDYLGECERHDDDGRDEDGDGDGAFDEDDECPDTAPGSEVDADGCSCKQLGNCDSDGDGVTDDHDECADTPANDDVDEAGCSCSQRDGDVDGVNDCDDACMDTPDGDDVDEAGCSVTGDCEGITRMVTATITADNHYALFVGSEDGASLSAIGGNELGHGGSPGRYNWSLPETYTFSTDESFIFVAAWSHDGVAQGLLAEFAADGSILLSGDTLWTVFATGMDKDDNDPHPTETEMATQIGLANAGGAWVAATVTDYYNGVAPWGRIDAISVEAQWMWHLATGANAFEPGNNHDEYLIFRAPIPCSPTDSNDPQGCSAQSVVSFTQGKRRNGDTVLSERSNPENALGEAQRDDTVNFVSLGFGGELILDFARAVLNETGDDVQIIETTYANRDGSWVSYPEQAEVYASKNGIDWVLLGIDRQDGTFDLGELDWARYFRLVDITDPSEFSANVNGFDVDAIEALSNCESLPIEEWDEDGDGVFDEDDECPDTAPGAGVGDYGCPPLAADAGGDATIVFDGSVTLGGSPAPSGGDGSYRYGWSPATGLNASDVANPTFAAMAAGTFTLTLTVTDGHGETASDDVVITVEEAASERVAGVVVGAWHNILLFDDDTIRLWGWDQHGQLGDGSLVTDIAAADAGSLDTLVAKTDGTAWVFGFSSAAPAQVSGAADIVQVGALVSGGVLLTSDGTVLGFNNDNNNCELAGVRYDGTVDPTPIPGLPTNITAIDAGAYHTVALDADGTAWVWGWSFGCTPWSVLDNVTAVAAGDSGHCLFLRGDGTVWSLGFNLHGQLGNGTRTTNYNRPFQVSGLTDVAAVAAGDRHSMFLKSDGTVWAWGYNTYDQLSGGTSTSLPDTVAIPVQIDFGE
ncbi:MAG: hypothetical protein WBE26_10325 [Phycisphaerae bacterium]